MKPRKFHGHITYLLNYIPRETLLTNLAYDVHLDWGFGIEETNEIVW